MLPLLLTAMIDNRLTIAEIIRLTNINPQKIFNLKQDRDTYLLVDLHEKWVINNKNLKTKCGWSPFHGWKVRGKLKQVFLRDKKVFENDKILINPGFGKNILQQND